MPRAELDVVTGAFGYTGRHITRRLLASGRRVRTLTGHPDRPNPFGPHVEARALAFDRPATLAEGLRGADTLYCTYWVRFARGPLTHAQAVRNLEALFAAARSAGVRRVVHVSITGASPESPLPYFRGKGQAEEALHASGLSAAVLRPALIFGAEDILLHNIAWILRHSPLFAIFGRGNYRLQPVHVDDLAALAVDLGRGAEAVTLDAVGPETYTYAGLVRAIARALGRRPRMIHVSPGVGWALAAALGLLVGDVVVTRDEIAGLMAGLLVSAGPPTAPTRLGAWLAEHAGDLGRHYVSEVERHYTRPRPLRR